jgi:cell division cycle protein 37
VYITSDDAWKYANMSISNYSNMYSYLRDHQSLVSQEIADEILASAFQFQMNNKPTKAYQYVHQALVLQFCCNLGKDGAMIFFSKCVVLYLLILSLLPTKQRFFSI